MQLVYKHSLAFLAEFSLARVCETRVCCGVWGYQLARRLFLLIYSRPERASQRTILRDKSRQFTSRLEGVGWLSLRSDTSSINIAALAKDHDNSHRASSLFFFLTIGLVVRRLPRVTGVRSSLSPVGPFLGRVISVT